MFINIDRNRTPQKPKYYLAKPNRQVVANLTSCKKDDSGTFKLGNIDEITFTIPYYIQDEDMNLSYNKDVDLIREKMLIKMVLGTSTEWFIIDEIEETGDDSEEITVLAFSLGYELTHKKVTALEMISVNASDALKKVLEDSQYPSPWKVEFVDYKFENLFRSFKFDDTNALDAVFKIAESFDALVVWHTGTRRVSFRDKEEEKSFKGLTMDYGKLLRSLKRNRTTDEFVTRLYVYGSEGLGIHNINPTGQSYIEDFSFYMYPFEMDANRKVIKSSYMMSDELCIALKDLEALTKQYADNFKKYNEERAGYITQKVAEESKLTQLKNQVDSINHRLDTAKAVEDEALISSIQSELSAKQAEVASQESVVSGLNNKIFNSESLINELTDKLRKESNFTQKLIDELNLYVIERDFKDDRYIDEQDLYDDAVKYFQKMREPKVVITIDIENFLEIVEEQYYWDKLALGELIKIRYPLMNIEYMATIAQIDYDFEDGSISLTIANTKKLNDMDILNDILYNSKTASTIIMNNRYIYDKIGELDGRVWKLINEEWDANKQQITAGVNNEIEIGKRGIIVTNPDNPNEMVIIQSGIIALSEDKGETWKTAIKPNGIVAERIMGKLILGTRLIIEDETGVIKFTGSLIEVFDRNDNIRVQLGEFAKGKYGLRIDSGAIEIINGLSKDNIDKGAVDYWDSIEGNVTDYMNQQVTILNQSISDISTDVEDLQSEISAGFRDGIIEESEAIAIEKYINELDASKLKFDREYTTVYADTFLTGTAKSDLSSAKTAFNTAHTNLINSINTAIKDRRTTVEESADVDAKFASYKTAMATLGDKIQSAILSIQSARALDAQNNANSYTNSKDSTLRDNLRLTAPLPNNITMNSSGITASTSNSNNFARLDYRGLYIQGGAFDIRTSSTTNSGVLINGSGISAYNSSGQRTFYVDVYGHMTATSGTFSGSLNGATGSFSGSLNAGSISSSTISGSTISAGTITGGSISGTSISGSTITGNTISGGTISGTTISGTTISGGTINGGTINGGSINGETDINITRNIYVGNNIYLAYGSSWNVSRSIIFANSASVTYSSDVMSMSSLGVARLESAVIELVGRLDLSKTTNVNWGSNKPVAVFG